MENIQEQGATKKARKQFADGCMEVEMLNRHDTQYGDVNKPLQQNKTSERTTSKCIVGAYKKHMSIHECASIHVHEACVAVLCNWCDCNCLRMYKDMKAYHVCPPPIVSVIVGVTRAGM